MQGLTNYEQTLLAGWEATYKMGQLSLWVMLALKAGPKHMAQIKQFIGEASGSVVTADDKSIYRALRRYHDADLVSFEMQPSSNGPDLKVYTLTMTGRNVLGHFLQRNISVFYNPDIRMLVEKG